MPTDPNLAALTAIDEALSDFAHDDNARATLADAAAEFRHPAPHMNSGPLRIIPAPTPAAYRVVVLYSPDPHAPERTVTNPMIAASTVRALLAQKQAEIDRLTAQLTQKQQPAPAGGLSEEAKDRFARDLGIDRAKARAHGINLGFLE